MNEEIKQILVAYCESQGWTTTDEDIKETLLDSNPIYTEVICRRRWWNDVFAVSMFGDNLIGFKTAQTTGDNSPSDVGWEFDPESVCMVKAVTKTITVYEPA